MVSSEDTRNRRAVRDAVQSLHQAVRTLRQHHLHPRLGQAAVQRCVAAVRKATIQAPLQLQMRDGRVAANGEAMFGYAAGDVPFGALATAGIGELTLAAEIDPENVERLIRLLAAGSGDDPENDIGSALRAADLHGVSMRAATSSDDAPRAERLRCDWWILPAAMPDQALQPLIERDGFANLPAEAARLLLADLDEAAAAGGPAPRAADAQSDGSPPAALLLPLLTALLQRGDGAAAGWLLERALHHPAVDAGTGGRLREQAIGACHGDWLHAQFEHRDRVQGLIALALQLGDETVQHLGNVAAEHAQSLPAWVRAFLPHDGSSG